MHTRILTLGCILAVGALPATARSADASREGIEFFEKIIRPLLTENCTKCHGAAKQKGMLRLDSRAALLKGGETGPVIVPGDPARSLLLKAIGYDDPDLRMPPRGKLADGPRADLAAWIAQGAPWPDDGGAKVAASSTFNLKERSKHWSLQPLRAVPLPRVKRQDWPQSPIDHFVLARLEAAGLAPAPPTDRRTLLRRVTYDLIGLPPTPAEIDAFLADNSPRAFERVVDRLLASPQYGERWARHWLDLVRFAETCGHEFDFDLPDAYRYRDYVIRALNADLPYDQFVVEHVAGDLVPQPRRLPGARTNESILGTGFWHLGEAKHSPVDVRGDQADRLDNQVDVFAKTFLGLTVACARCHDHKFDAISTKDYYGLYGYLQSSRFQHAFIDDPEPLRVKIRDLQRLHAEIRRAGGVNPLLMRHQQGVDTPRSPGDVVFADFRKDTFANWFVSGAAFGAAPSQSGAVLLQPDPRQPIKTLVAPGLAHSGLVSGRLQGVLRSATFLLEKNKIHYRALGQQGRIRLILDGFQLIRAPIYGGLEFAVNSPDLQWRTMDVSMWRGHRAYIELVDEGPGYLGVEQIVFNDGAPPAAIGNGGQTGPAAPAAATSRLADLLKQYQQLEATLPAPRRALALEDGTPVDERVFIRGSHKSLGELVPRRFLEVFGGTEAAAPMHGSGRLDLARRMVDPANTPIVPRVMVNRLWQHHFGSGIVRSPDDFGVLGQPPTHPELLDYLATTFVRDGWSLKKMHRLMLLSSTYQMASQAEERAETLDPQNRLLHRMPVRRLEAEAIRDALLAVSGRLDPTMYGPGVAPHLTPFMVGRGRPRVSGPLDGAGRRSIYINIRRNFLTPMFLAFDYPVPFSTMGRRGVSNVPAQALTMMNNPFVLQQAGLWAKEVLRDKRLTPRERIGWMYVTAFGRPPTETELTDTLAFLEEQAQVNGRGDEEGAWRDLCHVLVNVKEFIFVN